MIKAVAKRKIGFVNRKTKEYFEILPYCFVTLPEWAKYDPMYERAVRAGILELHETISVPVSLTADNEAKPNAGTPASEPLQDNAGHEILSAETVPEEYHGAKKSKAKKI